ncbi:hypothetical protein [Carnobacterium mobile]|uniref:hypothetical protein n=1 Tax=Carnobacterium mobile TaxID=2750 RepID=UPI0012EBCB0C|nr:hypothetical protein [Carnobacterium mobile]
MGNGEILKENTIKELDKEEKDAIKKKSEALKSLKEKFKLQENIVYTKKEKEELDKKID